MATCLSIIHDPLGLIEVEILDKYSHFFDDIFIVATEQTRNDVIDKLSQLAKVDIKPRNGTAQARRDVLKFAYHYVTKEPLFYCDLDRLIHWLKSGHRKEILMVLDYSTKYDFTIVGRTDNAFATHPYLQRETEQVMIDMVDVDCFAGARIMTADISRFLIEKSKAVQAAAIDIEWPDLVKSYGGKVGYIATNGLSFEGSLRSYQNELELRIDNLKSVVQYANRRWGL